jgi:hypothetical protein
VVLGPTWLDSEFSVALLVTTLPSFKARWRWGFSIYRSDV